MARRQMYHHQYRRRPLRKGRTFRRGNKLVRHVYRGSKKVGTEIVKTIWSGAKAGTRRFVSDRANYYLHKQYRKWRK